MNDVARVHMARAVTLTSLSNTFSRHRCILEHQDTEEPRPSLKFTGPRRGDLISFIR